MRDVEDVVDPDGPPPWLHLLQPMWRAWRETQILKGRDPDPYILGVLKKAGLWPPKAKTKPSARRKTKRVKRAKRSKPAPLNGKGNASAKSGRHGR